MFEIYLPRSGDGVIMGLPSWIIGVTVFLGLLFLWALEYAWQQKQQLARSNLKVEFDPQNIDGCIHEWVASDGPYKQFRVRVTNDSPKTIHNCAGHVVRVEQIEPAGGDPYPEVVPMTWARLGGCLDLNLRDGEPCWLNLLVMKNGAAHVQSMGPNTPGTPFRKFPAKYRVFANVMSDDTKLKKVECVFDWTGVVKTANVTDIKIS